MLHNSYLILVRIFDEFMNKTNEEAKLTTSSHSKKNPFLFLFKPKILGPIINNHLPIVPTL